MPYEGDMSASRVDDMPALIRGELSAPSPSVNGKDGMEFALCKKCRSVPGPSTPTTAGVMTGEPFAAKEVPFETWSDTPPPARTMITTTVRIKTPFLKKHIKHTLRDTSTMTVRVPVTSKVTENLGPVVPTVCYTTGTLSSTGLHVPSVTAPTTINTPMESTMNNVVVVSSPLTVPLAVM